MKLTSMNVLLTHAAMHQAASKEFLVVSNAFASGVSQEHSVNQELTNAPLLLVSMVALARTRFLAIFVAFARLDLQEHCVK